MLPNFAITIVQATTKNIWISKIICRPIEAVTDISIQPFSIVFFSSLSIDKQKVSKAFATVCSNLWAGKNAIFSLKKFHKVFCKYKETFADIDGQHDAHEFFTALIDLLQPALVRQVLSNVVRIECGPKTLNFSFSVLARTEYASRFGFIGVMVARAPAATTELRD